MRINVFYSLVTRIQVLTMRQLIVMIIMSVQMIRVIIILDVFIRKKFATIMINVPQIDVIYISVVNIHR